MINKFLIACLFLLIGGCALSGPKYERIQDIPVSKAALYIYRPDIFLNGGIVPGLKLDRQEYAAIPPGGYLPFLLDEGPHEIELVFSENYGGVTPFKLTVDRNSEYFVRVETEIWNGTRSFRLSIVDHDIGYREIVNNKLIDPVTGKRFSKSLIFEN